MEVEKIEHMFKTMIETLTRSVDPGTIKIELAETDDKVELTKSSKKSKCKCKSQ